MQVSKSALFVALTAFAIFHSSQVSLYLGSGIGQIIQLFSTICILPYVVRHIVIILSKKYLLFNISLILLCGWVLFSFITSRGYISGVTDQRSFFGVIMRCSALFFSALAIEAVTRTEYFSVFLKTFYFCALFYCLIAVMNFLTVDISSGEDYLYGTKFQVSYMAIFLFILYYSLNWKHIINYLFPLLLHIAFAAFICIVSGCMTALLGLAIVCIIILGFPATKFCFSPWSFLFGLLICDTILLSFQFILDIPAVSYFIEDILNKDITLTSRTRIYIQAPLFILERIVSGYGYGNSYEVCKYLFGAPNCQNGLLDFTLQTGIVGTILLLTSFFTCFTRISKTRNNIGILAMIYMYVAISSVEITLDLPLLILAMLMFNTPKIKTHETSIKTL